MTLNERIKTHEGFRSYVYDDATGEAIVSGYTVKGNPTIGYGRLLTFRNGITHQEGDALLQRDIDRSIDEVNMNLPFVFFMDETRKGVLIEMAFNMGINRLMTFKKMLTAVRGKDYTRAAEEMLDSKWAGQVGKRAVTLASIMETGA